MLVLSRGDIFGFGPPKTKMRSSSHDSRSPDLPVKSRSREVAHSRHSSFCDSGCSLAAQYVLNTERRRRWLGGAYVLGLERPSLRWVRLGRERLTASSRERSRVAL